MTPNVVSEGILYFVFGVLLGALHVAALRYNVLVYTHGSAVRGAVLHLVRFLVLGTVLLVVALRGAVPLVALIVGFTPASIWASRSSWRT